MSNENRTNKILETEKSQVCEIPGFLKKTYNILEKEEFSPIICWSSDGKSFRIKDVKLFEKEVLPLYFKHNKCTSFVRQLNMYDFHKLRLKDKSKEFKHAYFQRGKFGLLAHIQRKTTENSSVEDNLLAKFNELQAQQKLLKEQNAKLREEKKNALIKLREQEDPKISLLLKAREVLQRSQSEKLSSQDRCILELTNKFV